MRSRSTNRGRRGYIDGSKRRSFWNRRRIDDRLLRRARDGPCMELLIRRIRQSLLWGGAIYGAMLLSGCSHTERTSYVDAWWHSARAVSGASKQISARDLIRTRDIGGESYAGGLVFSKDGSLVAFQVQQANPSSGKYATAWYVSSTVRGAEPRFVGEGGEPILLGEYTRSTNGGRVRASAFWSHDQKWIYYPLKRDGVIELWRSDVNGGYQERISFLNARVQNIALSLNGKTVVF